MLVVVTNSNHNLRADSAECLNLLIQVLVVQYRAAGTVLVQAYYYKLYCKVRAVTGSWGVPAAWSSKKWLRRGAHYYWYTCTVPVGHHPLLSEVTVWSAVLQW